MTLVAAVAGGLIIGRLGLAEYVKDARIVEETEQAVAADGGTTNCCAGSSLRPRVGNPLAVPLAGSPVYISLSGMLPIAASLNQHGIAIGTALAFVIGGAGVSIPNLILLILTAKTSWLSIYEERYGDVGEHLCRRPPPDLGGGQ